jgi:hypothetical protein
MLGIDPGGARFAVGLAESGLEFRLELRAPHKHVPIELEVPVPYRLNEEVKQSLEDAQGNRCMVAWNGVIARVVAERGDAAPEMARDLGKAMNEPAALVRNLAVVPLMRGFSKPSYGQVPLGHLMETEDEVAARLVAEPYLVEKVSHYLELVLGREFRCNVTPGTTLFPVTVMEKGEGRGAVPCEVVNDGFGVNQVAYMLARCLHQDQDGPLVCIEEPEIHLHPTAIRSLAAGFVDMARDERLRFVMTTHSEAFVVALLSQVTKGRLKPEDLALYLAGKSGRESTFHRQEVTKEGQVEGGISSFIEAELEDLKEFLGVPTA